MGICLRYANNRPDASSMINEGFLKVFTHIKKYDRTRPFKAWISRIMTNSAIDHYRANLRFSNNDDLHNHEDLSISLDAIHDKLNYQDLLLMIQSLSPACRTVFNLYAIEGYSHEEIADMLHISIGTSKSNLFKARSKLMDKLKAMDAEVGSNDKTVPRSISRDVDFND